VLPLRLVIEGTIIIIAPVIALSIVLLLSAPVLNPTACISVADDIAQVMVVSTMPLATLLRWSDATGRVPAGTLPVVIFVTSIFILLVMG
jgi:hypothetical protein